MLHDDVHMHAIWLPPTDTLFCADLCVAGPTCDVVKVTAVFPCLDLALQALGLFTASPLAWLQTMVCCFLRLHSKVHISWSYVVSEKSLCCSYRISQVNHQRLQAYLHFSCFKLDGLKHKAPKVCEILECAHTDSRHI